MQLLTNRISGPRSLFESLLYAKLKVSQPHPWPQSFSIPAPPATYKSSVPNMIARPTAPPPLHPNSQAPRTPYHRHQTPLPADLQALVPGEICQRGRTHDIEGCLASGRTRDLKKSRKKNDCVKIRLRIEWWIGDWNEQVVRTYERTSSASASSKLVSSCTLQSRRGKRSAPPSASKLSRTRVLRCDMTGSEITVWESSEFVKIEKFTYNDPKRHHRRMCIGKLRNPIYCQGVFLIVSGRAGSPCLGFDFALVVSFKEHYDREEQIEPVNLVWDSGRMKVSLRKRRRSSMKEENFSSVWKLQFSKKQSLEAYLDVLPTTAESLRLWCWRWGKADYYVPIDYCATINARAYCVSRAASHSPLCSFTSASIFQFSDHD